MPANIDPIFTRAPDVQWVAIPSAAAANTAVDGTGTVYTVWTADATNGGFLQRLRIKAANISVATVLRVFINNGSTNATAANNILFEEMGLVVITATNTAATLPFEIPMNIALPPGYKVNVCLATSVTGIIQVTGVGGKY